MPDMAFGTRPWQAAQFAVTHRWITTKEVGFAPEDIVTRAQAATILAHAFSLGPPPESKLWRAIVQLDKWPKPAKQAYEDVPLYLDYAFAVEAWHERGFLAPCKNAPALFCPSTPITTNEFINSVAGLSAQKVDYSTLHRSVAGKEDDPLTRSDAVLILYNSVR